MRIFNLVAASLALMLAATGAWGEQPAKARYDTRPAIEREMEGAVVPATRSLAYLLGRLLPAEGDRVPAIGLTMTPADPKEPGDPFEPVAITFSCVFGEQVCEPFFKACTALQQSCTGTCACTDPVTEACIGCPN